MNRDWFDEKVSADLRTKTLSKVSDVLAQKAQTQGTLSARDESNREQRTATDRETSWWQSVGSLMGWQGSALATAFGAAVVVLLQGLRVRDLPNSVETSSVGILDSILESELELDSESIEFLAELELLDVLEDLESEDGEINEAKDRGGV